ncbi:hypothetical protein EJ03DRAFT_343413 [Teratosphaeria nubilosa]|uniref:Grh/CP2 DB domain-containing protein n=1 Tax=Teratosphaeria nubilosa TaxID=161662 RepID=A0A6G1LAF0_9PEZI|nr:hypothetical protein EJ03DRAFT_343413 [Teratosphaeria nubilosa]
MFSRRQSQKPSDELYRNFKANFPRLSQTAVGTTAPSAHGASSLAEALDILPLPTARPMDIQPHDMKDADPTPRGSNEPWNFGTSGLTPSMMDPNSQSFNMFANQIPGYYTPTPGGNNTHYHNQAGDLHTPGFGVGLGTPLSLPTSESALHAGQQGAFHNFQPQLPQHLHQPSFQNVNPFHMHQQQSFPPHHFTNQPSFDGLDGHVDDSPVDDLGMDVSMQQFRYHVTLNAPTAMIKHSDEIPVTYLNKGQAYTLNVVDTHAQQSAAPVKYRTFVRVSFEDEQQRQKPAACWQLWKEGRGTNEAHHRGGRLQAVEYVESGQLGSAEDPSKPRIELECSSYDGFCVVWSPPAGAAECPISVRFNFLSTDFSHSKGVKGIPVRLCAKTEMLGDLSPSSPSGVSEVCYCKVKLFRDHGAERKLSNDVAHVKKTIDKLNQQIAQIESGMRDLGKRKRGNAAKSALDERPGKVPKHRRTWSVTSVTSNGGRGSAEEDLHMKLMTLQDMFTSTRPASVLYLRGDDQDDPDLYPVKLSGEPLALVRTDTQEWSAWERQSTQDSTAVSPSPSSRSGHEGRRDSTLQQPTPLGGTSRVNSSEWRSNPQTATMDIQSTLPQQLASPPDNQPVKIQTKSPGSGVMSGWVEALGVDPQYQPPAERAAKPIACFYVQARVAGQKPADNFHRAIYLTRRTTKDLVNAIAMKCDMEPTKVLRVIRINRQGISILVNDECVREIPEGQDMKAEISKMQPSSPSRGRREWDAGPSDLQCDGDVPTAENISADGYEMKLLF